MVYSLLERFSQIQTETCAWGPAARPLPLKARPPWRSAFCTYHLNCDPNRRNGLGKAHQRCNTMGREGEGAAERSRQQGSGEDRRGKAADTATNHCRPTPSDEDPKGEAATQPGNRNVSSAKTLPQSFVAIIFRSQMVGSLKSSLFGTLKRAARKSMP